MSTHKPIFHTLTKLSVCLVQCFAVLWKKKQRVLGVSVHSYPPLYRLTYLPTVLLSPYPPLHRLTYLPTFLLSPYPPLYHLTYPPTFLLSPYLSAAIYFTVEILFFFYITEIVFSSSCCAPFRYFKYLHFNPIIVDLLYSPLYTGGSSPLLLSEA